MVEIFGARRQWCLQAERLSSAQRRRLWWHQQHQQQHQRHSPPSHRLFALIHTPRGRGYTDTHRSTFSPGFEPFLTLQPRHVLCCHRDGGVGAQLPADAAEAGRAGMRLSGTLPGCGSRDEPGVGHRRRPVLPVPVGVLLETNEHRELAVQQHAGRRLAGCYAGPVARGWSPGADVIPGRSGCCVHRHEAAILRTRRFHALCCSCPSGLQFGPLPHQVH